ncbi:MAG: hypothetical protein ABW220_04520 [Burkholderiaceae bacterium]
MPALIEHIDAIARRKGRAALYLEFHPQDAAERRAYHHEQDPMRARVLAWLDANGVPWRPCGPLANPSVMASWRGQVYLDLPWDEALPAYQVLRDYLELPDGSMRHAGVRFYAMPLELAMENAEHDEPGYWQRRAEKF